MRPPTSKQRTLLIRIRDEIVTRCESTHARWTRKGGTTITVRFFDGVVDAEGKLVARIPDASIRAVERRGWVTQGQDGQYWLTEAGHQLVTDAQVTS